MCPFRADMEWESIKRITFNYFEVFNFDIKVVKVHEL